MFNNRDRRPPFQKRLSAAGKHLVRRSIMSLPLTQARWLLFAAVQRRLPHLTRPQAFNEKVNWRVIFDRNPLLVAASSKVESKMLAKQWAPDIHLPKTIWHGTDLEDLAHIRTERRWVLKASHRSGCVLSGTPDELVPDQLKAKTKNWLREYEYKNFGLWAYGQVRREYILEEWVEDLADFPTDYKFFVFNGQIAMIQVDVGRFGGLRRNLYTADWTPLPYTYTCPGGSVTPPPPNFAAMCQAAQDLGARFDFIRVDLYNVCGRTFFGELTAYPAGGFSHWPRALDLMIGAFWSLPVVQPQSKPLMWTPDSLNTNS